MSAAPLYAECSLILDGFDEPVSVTKNIRVDCPSGGEGGVGVG
jgi:hypothetical protein